VNTSPTSNWKRAVRRTRPASRSFEIKTSFLRDTSGRAIGFVGVTRDISERVQAQRETEKIQEQLAQAQKMEALGTLVGGLAHDFNNILIGIMGSYDLLGMLLENNCLRDKDEIDQYLRLGADSARRAADLIKQLLALSKKHGIALTPVDITESLRHIRDICRNSFPKSVALDFRIAERPLVVMGDMVQIEQVLLNLCINASHAMTVMRDPSERQGGVLTVEADEIGPEADGGRGRIRIQISDTGVGMDAETRISRRRSATTGRGSGSRYRTTSSTRTVGGSSCIRNRAPDRASRCTCPPTRPPSSQRAARSPKTSSAAPAPFW